jgi:capsular exopolysaccharide synthesis family protein
MNNSNQAIDRPRKKAENIGLEATPSSAADDASLDLGAIWETLKRNKWVILLTCVLVTGAVGGYTWTLPKVYEADAIVSVEAPETPSPAMKMGAAPELASEIGILRNSGELSRRVLETLRTVADTTEASFPLLTPKEEGESVDDHTLVQRLQERMKFEGSGEQGLITITAMSESPKEAAVIANIFAEEYQSFSQEIAREGVVAARKFLEGQLEKRKEDIREIEQEWEEFARSNDVATEGKDGQQVASEYVELQTKRDALQFELEQERRRLEIMKSQLDKSEPNLRESVKGEQKVQGLRTQIQALEDQIADLKAEAEQYYINDPSLRGNESEVPELAEIQRRIEGFEERRDTLTEDLVEATQEAGHTTGDGNTALSQMSSQREQIEAQEQKIGQLEAQIEGLEKRISKYQSRISNIPQQTVRREQLDRRLSQAERFYNDIANELQKTIIAEESELGYVKVMRTAVVPMFPVSPDYKQNLLLGLLLGLGLGVGGAFVRQSMNWHIYEPDDIQKKGYSLVGVIPKMDREIKKAFKGDTQVEVDGKQLSTSLFPLLNPWSPITENYRLVRANLRYASQKNGKNGTHSDEGAQTMLITSPEPGDGKTTTAVNLGITISLSGHSVLLIDADLRRPNAHKLLGLERSPGLADILDGETSLDGLIQTTVVDGLSFLAAGVPDVPPTELLDSERMQTLLSAARSQFDVVIVDTPPVLAATDPVVIAPYCDSVLVVASAEKTDFRALSQVRSTLNAVGVSLGGVIFNQYDASKGSSAYRYGYGYDYDYLPMEEA